MSQYRKRALLVDAVAIKDLRAALDPYQRGVLRFKACGDVPAWLSEDDVAFTHTGRLFINTMNGSEEAEQDMYLLKDGLQGLYLVTRFHFLAAYEEASQC